MILDLLRADGSIVVNKNLVHAIGLNAAVMFSELISKKQYFEDRGMLTEDGYFFNTVDNIRLDTGLGEKPQTAAIKKLEKLGLIETEKRGLPAKRHFKITANDALLIKILTEGSLIKEALKIELNEKMEKKTDVYTSHINSSSQMAELEHPFGRINNTKNNNNKNKKNIYIISEENDVLSYYSKKFKEKFGKDHPTMTKEKMDELIGNFDFLNSSLDIDQEKWFDCVDYHFEHLSPNNNGNILSFLAPNGGYSCIHRYLEDMSMEDSPEYEEFIKWQQKRKKAKINWDAV
jgi:hypothetical protein